MESIVTIEKLVAGGYGLARTGEGVIFVDGAAPGDRLRIEPAGKKGGIAVAKIAEVIEPSPARRTPPCPCAGRCGGCDWIHLDYAAQPAAKAAIVGESLFRIGRIAELPEIEIVYGPEFGYRHRVQIKIDAQGNAGFFARGTNDVVPTSRCPLLVDPLNDLLQKLNGEVGAEAEAILRATRNLPAIAGDGEAIASSPALPGLTSEKVAISAGKRTFEVWGGDFFQSNRPLLERLGSWAAPYVKGEKCLDLYGGTGFFGIMLADRFKEGLLIDPIGSHIERATRNFRLNGISDFMAGKGVAEDLPAIAARFKPDCLIIDPPRPGMTRKVREAIASLKPAQVLYISCNPPTQARDAGFLINKAGYRISHAAMFDLYPNTHHIESGLVLER